jgi:hypothetical protein
MIPVTSTEYLFVPVFGPQGTDPTQYTAQVALVAEGREPGDGDWHAATWLAPAPAQDPQAALLVGPGTGAVAYPQGEYVAWAKLAAGSEAPVMKSGRVRIGDAGL